MTFDTSDHVPEPRRTSGERSTCKRCGQPVELVPATASRPLPWWRHRG